jgi:SAM-dependent methyltransferase
VKGTKGKKGPGEGKMVSLRFVFGTALLVMVCFQHFYYMTGFFVLFVLGLLNYYGDLLKQFAVDFVVGKENFGCPDASYLGHVAAFWMKSDRYKAVAIDALRKLLVHKPRKSVETLVEVGFGPGFALQELKQCSFSRVVGVERSDLFINELDRAMCPANLEVVKSGNLDFLKDNSVDAMLIVNTIQHVGNLENYCQQIFRTLSGESGVCLIANCFSFINDGVVINVEMDEVKAMCKKAGFHVAQYKVKDLVQKNNNYLYLVCRKSVDQPKRMEDID